CDAVRFGAALAVTNEHVQPDASQQRRFSVLPADQQNELTAPPQARLLVDEPEHGLEHGLLPQLQPHRMPHPLALAVAAEPLDELDGPRSPLGVEDPRISGVVQLGDELLVLL